MVDAVSQPWRILVVGSSHNDIGWAGTPSEIAEHREHGIIDAVLDLLARDPHYAYAVEASLYADEYLARNPQRADYIRALVESGRLEWAGRTSSPTRACTAARPCCGRCTSGASRWRTATASELEVRGTSTCRAGRATSRRSTAPPGSST